MRRLACLILLLCTSASAAAATLYRVTLTLYPGDDAAAVARQVAATYGGRIAEPPGDGQPAFTVELSDATATLAARDPRVETLAVMSDADPTWTRGTYTYDGSGNISQIGTDDFRYDLSGRLVYGDAGTDAKQSYAYDAFGNILTIDTQERLANGTLQTDQSRIAADSATNQIDKPGTSFNVVGQYDLSGNLTSYNGTTILSYDALNVVKDAIIPGVTGRRVFLYTASDERIATMSVAGTTVTETEWTLRDASGKVLRRISKTPTGPWKWEEDYVYRGSQLLAAQVADNRKTLRFHLDHLGTPHLITANGGVEVARPRYFAFGQEVRATADAEPMKFTGHERDGRSLDYMHARYYDPLMGRFVSVDPTWDSADLGNPQSWNRYSYVLNKPLQYTDPDGKVALADDVLIGLFIGAVAITAYVQAPSVTHPGKTNGQAMAATAVVAAKAVGTAITSVMERVKEDSPDRVIIGESMPRVEEGAMKTGAMPLTVDTGRDAVAQSVTGVGAALAAGARIFDVGLDPRREDRSAPYAAELVVLEGSGRVRVPQSTTTIRGVETTVWEWVVPVKK